MCDTIKEIINSLGLPLAYLKAFQESGVDDELLVSKLKMELDLFPLLAGIIPPTKQRQNFITAFRMQHGERAVVGKAPGKKTCSVRPCSSGHGSVQIMEFEEVQGDGASQTRKTIMLEKEFRKVIEKCTPGAPVAVLAIAGKANKGKSLFLSFVLRYLNALQNGNGNADWMGWNEEEERPLNKGFRWANGYKVVTKGIWTLSEPISIKNSKGQVFDVLLLDTQGVFDEETGQREWNILAGLSLLTSSVIILNTSNDVQEDTLESLQNFLSFGLLALDRDDSPEGASKPFQNLVFLVRDWENHQEFPFGNVGGRDFIEKKLQEKPGHDEFHRQLRSQMKGCFESIDCFLFPFPGRVVRESSFTGSVVNSSSDYREFAQHVQLCIEQLLNPDHFPLKTLNGNVLTASDVFGLFKSYVDIFNSDQLPSSSDLYNATASRCNDMIIARCVTAFVETFESGLSSVPFLNEQEFVKTQETAEKDAETLFQKSREMGDHRVVEAAKSELKNKLDEKAAYFTVIYQNKLAVARQSLEQKIKEILSGYEAELESKVGGDVLYPKVFNDIHGQVASNARQKFQDLHCHPSLEPEGLAMLDHQIQNVDRWLVRVKMNKEMAEQAFLAAAGASAIEYSSTLSSFDFSDLEAMEEAEAKARSKVLKSLQSFQPKLEKDMYEKVKRELTAQLDAMYEKTVAPLENKLSLERDQAKVQAAIETVVEMYVSSMDKHVTSASIASRTELKHEMDLTGVTVSPDGLASFHNQCESDALKYMSEFVEKNCENLKNAKLLEQQSNAQLLLRISQEFSNLKRLNDQKLKALRLQFSKYLSEAQQEFANDLNRLAGRTTDPARFASQATDLKNRVKGKFQHLMESSILDENDLREHQSAMEYQMDNLISLKVKVMDSKRKEEEASARARAQAKRSEERLRRMEQEREEQEQRIREAARAQEEAQRERERQIRRQKEAAEKQQKLLEAARAEAEANKEKERNERRRQESEEQWQRVTITGGQPNCVVV